MCPYFGNTLNLGPYPTHNPETILSMLSPDLHAMTAATTCEVTFIALGFDVAKFGGFDELLVLFILGACHSFNCKGK